MEGKELQRLYDRRFGERSTYREKIWDVLMRDWFDQYLQPQDTVLDLGAGYGEFISRAKVAKRYAIDLNPDTAEKVGPGVETILHDCAKPWPLTEGVLDVVFTSNFFEHLPDKAALLRTLAEAYRCLTPSGKIIAMGPNIKYVGGAYWDFIDHHIPLTETSLAEALSASGFRIVSVVPRFLPYTMSSGPRYPAFFVSLYLRIPLAWRIFGRQFLVIGEKT